MDKNQVVTLMKSSQSGAEWDANCDKVKAAHEGRYPEYWFAEILASGVARETMANFGASPDIRIG